jgi:hypothetical protein
MSSPVLYIYEQVNVVQLTIQPEELQLSITEQVTQVQLTFEQSVSAEPGNFFPYTITLSDVLQAQVARTDTGLSTITGAFVYDPDGYQVLADVLITPTHVNIYSNISLANHQLIIF